MSYAFVSYVREDKKQIDKLRSDLSRFGIDAWVDRFSIDPGSSWESELYVAIENCDYFIACFSKESQSRTDSWMQRELQMALKSVDDRPMDRVWFIPVRLSGVPVPPLRSPGGRSIEALHCADLFIDWNLGVGGIVHAIRPTAFVDAVNHKRKMITANGAKRHINSQIQHFRAMGALNIEAIEMRWRTCVEGDSLELLKDVSLRIFDRAVDENQVITDRYVEPAADGRVVWISAAPNYRNADLLASLPIDTMPDAPRSRYVEFVKQARRTARTLPNWRERDFVHWIFRQEGPTGEMELDLLYFCSLNTMLRAMRYRNSEAGQAMPLAQVYPTTVLSTHELTAMINEVLLEEAKFSASQRTST
jgi:hypothetical protein